MKIKEQKLFLLNYGKSQITRAELPFNGQALKCFFIIHCVTDDSKKYYYK